MMAVVQKINSISQKESIALSYLRIIATLLIVICHFLEAFDNRWAYVCNIGVQIFLVMSGYLYGRKEITHWKDWFIKRIEKVYLPMFILITIVFILYFFLCRNELSVLSCLMYYFDLQGFAFAGGGNLL